jgi:hypothetical protein
MKGNQAGTTILIVVGILCLLYAAVRFFVLDQSAVPLAPVGFVCVGIGVVLGRKSSN